jgi:hypothetical protein
LLCPFTINPSCGIIKEKEGANKMDNKVLKTKLTPEGWADLLSKYMDDEFNHLQKIGRWEYIKTDGYNTLWYNSHTQELRGRADTLDGFFAYDEFAFIPQLFGLTPQ